MLCFLRGTCRRLSAVTNKNNSINYNRRRKEREHKLPLVITKAFVLNAALFSVSPQKTMIFDVCVTVSLGCLKFSRLIVNARDARRLRLFKLYIFAIKKTSKTVLTPKLAAVNLSKHLDHKAMRKEKPN